MANSKHSFKDLAHWFDRQKRVLPWRDDPSVYRVWISEIMLQQTQVVTVIPYFEKFMRRFPTLQSIARATEADVLLYWSGLGYYSRARNIYRAAQMMVREGVPESREGWLEIPGIGPYTAGAILSIALNQPEAILDGNVERVLSRLYCLSRIQLGEKKYKERLWKLAREAVEEGFKKKIKPSNLNQALMELGAMVCQPKSPRCELCPLAGSCQALKRKRVNHYPTPKKPKAWIAVQEEVDAIFDSKGRVLFERRPPGEWRAGLWDLLHPQSSRPIDLTGLGTVESRHVVTRHKITRKTHVWQISERSWSAAEPKFQSNQSFFETRRWVNPLNPEVAVGSAVKKSLQLVLERFEELRSCIK